MFGFKWSDLNPLNWWKAGQQFTQNAVYKIIEYFIYGVINALLSVFNDVLNIMLTIFSDTVLGITGWTARMGMWGLPLFVLINLTLIVVIVAVLRLLIELM